MNQKGIAHILMIILLLAGIVAGVYLVQHQQIFKPRASELVQESEKINRLTNQLVSKNEELKRRQKEVGTLSEDEKQELLVIASKRKEKLLAQLDKSPEEFIQNAILIDKRGEFPDEVKKLIEDKIDAKGKIDILHADPRDDKSEGWTNYIFHPEDRQDLPKHVRVKFTDDPKNIKGNSRIELKGVILERHAAVSQEKDGVSILDETLTAPPTLGQPKVAVIILRFQNTPSEPFTPDQVAPVMFGTDPGSQSAARLLSLSSYNQFNIQGDIYNNVVIPFTLSSASDCRIAPFDWADSAMAILSQRVNLSQYEYKYFVHPDVRDFTSHSSCAYAGSAILSEGLSWSNGFNNVRVYAHELGHNLGVHHANSLSCSADMESCSSTEYGDPFDVMGYPDNMNTHHFNAPHRVAVGWIPTINSSRSRVQNITDDGTYQVYNLESGLNNIQVLRISRPNLNNSYYLEYREAVGFDSSLPSSATQGVLVHTWDDAVSQTQLIDATPGSPEGFRDATLSDGQTFTDRAAGITIKQISHDTDKVVVEVKLHQFRSLLLSQWQYETGLTGGGDSHGSYGSSAVLVNIVNRRIILLGGGYPYGSYSSVNDMVPEEKVSIKGGGVGEVLYDRIKASEIQPSGNLSPWRNVGSLPKPLLYLSSVYAKGYIFVLGGRENGGSASSSVYSVRITDTDDDYIGSSWATLNPLPRPLEGSAVVVYRDNLYIFGGTSSSSSYKTSINNDGTIGNWVELTPLPVTLHGHTAVINGDTVYVIGGWSDQMPSGNVYVTRINSDGTLNTWTTTSSLPNSLNRLSSIIAGDRILVFGGFDYRQFNLGGYPIWRTVTLARIYTTSINPGGSLSEWVREEVLLPKPLYGHNTVLSGSNIYLLGGRNQYASEGVYRSQLSLSLTPSPQPSPTPTPSPITLSLDNNIVVAGTTINVAWNNLNNGLEKDWAAIFKQSDPSEARYFKEWLFLGSCSRQSQGRIPGSSGSCSIKVPDNLPVGVYELRLMTNNTYNVVATFQSLIVGGGDNFIVSASPNPVRSGQTVNLSWSGITTFKEKDWVGMFKTNDPASAGYLKEWIFLATCSRQSQTNYVPGPAGNCTLTIPSNLSEGEYNFRFMTDNQYQVIGTTRNINVRE